MESGCIRTPEMLALGVRLEKGSHELGIMNTLQKLESKGNKF